MATSVDARRTQYSSTYRALLTTYLPGFRYHLTLDHTWLYPHVT